MGCCPPSQDALCSTSELSLPVAVTPELVTIAEISLSASVKTPNVSVSAAAVPKPASKEINTSQRYRQSRPRTNLEVRLSPPLAIRRVLRSHTGTTLVLRVCVSKRRVRICCWIDLIYLNLSMGLLCQGQCLGRTKST